MPYSTPCQYSIKLIEKLKSLDTANQLDFALINKAICWAKKYHDGQMRKSGEAFYTHPLQVAYMIADYLCSTDSIITSILHDTLEDTALTKEMIITEFGAKIADQVEDLTRIKDGYKISSAEIVKLLWQQQKYEVLLIKLFDRLHNVLTMHVKSPEKQKKMISETLVEFLPVATYFSLFHIENILDEVCFNITSSHNPPDYQLEFTKFEECSQLFSQAFRNASLPT